MKNQNNNLKNNIESIKTELDSLKTSFDSYKTGVKSNMMIKTGSTDKSRSPEDENFEVSDALDNFLDKNISALNELKERLSKIGEVSESNSRKK